MFKFILFLALSISVHPALAFPQLAPNTSGGAQDNQQCIVQSNTCENYYPGLTGLINASNDIGLISEVLTLRIQDKAKNREVEEYFPLTHVNTKLNSNGTLCEIKLNNGVTVLELESAYKNGPSDSFTGMRNDDEDDVRNENSLTLTIRNCKGTVTHKFVSEIYFEKLSWDSAKHTDPSYFYRTDPHGMTEVEYRAKLELFNPNAINQTCLAESNYLRYAISAFPFNPDQFIQSIGEIDTKQYANCNLQSVRSSKNYESKNIIMFDPNRNPNITALNYATKYNMSWYDQNNQPHVKTYERHFVNNLTGIKKNDWEYNYFYPVRQYDGTFTRDNITYDKYSNVSPEEYELDALQLTLAPQSGKVIIDYYFNTINLPGILITPHYMGHGEDLALTPWFQDLIISLQ